MKKIKFLAVILLLLSGACAYGADDERLAALSRQITEAKSNLELYEPFTQLEEVYFTDNKYSEFVDFLKTLRAQKESLAAFTDYYTALARIRQLKYLEEKQNWDEYFAKGNDYRDEINECLKNAIGQTSAKEALNIYARLLFWKFHRDMQGNLSEPALSELMNAAIEYSNSAEDILPVKTAADELSSYAEKGKAKELYKIYARKISGSNIKDEDLKNIAAGFYQEGNLDLAEDFYDVYIGRALKADWTKEKIAYALIDIAKLFAYRDAAMNDPDYAEQVFAQAENTGGKEVFDEELKYLRAFNLEKAQLYRQARDLYAQIAGALPKGRRADEAGFKAGAISTYILRDPVSGGAYFEKLAQSETNEPQAVSALYQLGLLAQWQGDVVRAKEYYNKAIDKAKGNFPQAASYAGKRIKEIDEKKPLDYNLQQFLDLSLKEENAQFNMSKIDLKPVPCVVKKGEGISVAASPFLSESGCMQVQTQFLWAGDLGSAAPNPSESDFNTDFNEPGTKIIFLVVATASGSLDRSISLIDVY